MARAEEIHRAFPSRCGSASKPYYAYDLVAASGRAVSVDLYNQGVNAESFLYRPRSTTARAKALMMLFKRIREIDVPEMMASIIFETKGKPWDYYRDMSRQLWDEARHAMMGEVGFVARSGSTGRGPGSRTTGRSGSTPNARRSSDTRCSTYIEQGLMAKTGKKLRVGGRAPTRATPLDGHHPGLTTGPTRSCTRQIGRDWYIPQIGHWKEALAYGDQCWSRITSNWAEVRDQGLTEHANWWPSIYLQACRTWGIEPDPKALAFAETYEGQRADLKGVGASG